MSPDLYGVLEMVCLKHPKNRKTHIGSRCLKNKSRAKPPQSPAAFTPAGESDPRATWKYQLTEEADFK